MSDQDLERIRRELRGRGIGGVRGLGSDRDLTLLLREVDTLRQGVWDMLRELGYDLDGNAVPAMPTSELVHAGVELARAGRLDSEATDEIAHGALAQLAVMAAGHETQWGVFSADGMSYNVRPNDQETAEHECRLLRAEGETGALVYERRFCGWAAADGLRGPAAGE